MSKAINILRRDAKNFRATSEEHRKYAAKLAQQREGELELAERANAQAEELEDAVIALGGTLEEPVDAGKSESLMEMVRKQYKVSDAAMAA